MSTAFSVFFIEIPGFIHNELRALITMNNFNLSLLMDFDSFTNPLQLPQRKVMIDLVSNISSAIIATGAEVALMLECVNLTLQASNNPTHLCDSLKKPGGLFVGFDNLYLLGAVLLAGTAGNALA